LDGTLESLNTLYNLTSAIIKTDPTVKNGAKNEIVKLGFTGRGLVSLHKNGELYWHPAFKDPILISAGLLDFAVYPIARRSTIYGVNTGRSVIKISMGIVNTTAMLYPGIIDSEVMGTIELVPEVSGVKRVFTQMISISTDDNTFGNKVFFIA
jgi:hypothetical protein